MSHIFHQNHSAFLRWLPSQDLKTGSCIISGFFFLSMYFSSILYLTDMPNLSPTYIAKMRSQDPNSAGWWHHTKRIRYSSQLLPKSIIFPPLTILVHEVPCYELEPRQHSAESCLRRLTTTWLYNRDTVQCLGLYPDLLPPYYTGYVTQSTK